MSNTSNNDYLNNTITQREIELFTTLVATVQDIEPYTDEELYNAVKHFCFVSQPLAMTEQWEIITEDGLQFDLEGYTRSRINHDNRPFEDFCGKPAKPKRKTSVNATELGDRLVLPSDKRFANALSVQKNKHAFIARMKPDFFNNFTIENGSLRYDAKELKASAMSHHDDIEEIDTALLWAIYTVAYNARLTTTKDTITVSMPKFLREMGKYTGSSKTKGGESKAAIESIMDKLNILNDCVGITDGRVDKIFSMVSFDEASQTMTFAAPYLIRIIEKTEESAKVAKKTRKGVAQYTRPHLNKLIHTTIESERNKVAIELVGVITSGLLTRGTTPDAKTYSRKNKVNENETIITYAISFKSLINDAPLLRSRINAQSSTADKNKTLKRAFEGAYKLLKTKTDVYTYFKDFNITEKLPTMSVLDDELTITYTGIF